LKQTIKSLEEAFDKEAISYDHDTNNFHHKISEYVLYENLKSALSNLDKPRILDAGCGTGKIAMKLLKTGHNVVLLDLSSASLKIAQEKIENEKIQTKYCKGSCENTPFEDGSFDFIMLNGAVMSYTPNPEILVQEMFRILAKNGRLWFDLVGQ